MIKWLSITFSIVSTGSGLALLQIRDVSPVIRAAAQSLVILGVIIAIPPAIDALIIMGNHIRQLVDNIRERQSKEIDFVIQNNTGNRLELEFSADEGDYWPGNGSVYWLASWQSGRYSFACRYTRQKICYGAWIAGQQLGSYWGVGYRRANGCTNCCAYCGDRTVSLNLTH
jgi:hypothetical protein